MAFGATDYGPRRRTRFYEEETMAVVKPGDEIVRCAVCRQMHSLEFVREADLSWCTNCGAKLDPPPMSSKEWALYLGFVTKDGQPDLSAFRLAIAPAPAPRPV